MPQGLIISNISNQYMVEVENVIYISTARGKMKKDEIVPVVGDKVEIEILDFDQKEAVITKILPRTNYLKRPKIANLTKIFLVVSMKMPKPDLLLLDKQLAFAEYLGITPVILLNKIDLENNEAIENVKKIYTDIGYQVLLVCAKDKDRISNIKELLKGQVSAFSGNSGVGKSTLLNSIFEKEMTEEGVISTKNKKGKNTTTSIKLYKIENDTYLADTPGFSTFEVFELEKENLYRYFKEFVPFEKECSFVGCTHVKEKECGIKKALEAGKIAKSRYENYQKIYEDLKEREDHKW